MNNSHSNGRHILIVDDEPLVRRSLGELLALSGYTVSTASNGEEALNLLKDYTADIIISDIKMPQMDGVELLRKLKVSHPDTPVILITGYSSIESAVEAIEICLEIFRSDAATTHRAIAFRAIAKINREYSCACGQG